METKRVACLYRVSTKSQAVDGTDIPLQRKACEGFIARQPGWVLTAEFVEAGVSGYKKSASEREELDKLLNAAERHEFDVVLLFMFDRLGRKEDESPIIAKRIIDSGAELWSVQEGRQTLNNIADKLMNYMRFLQANEESRKTGVRVENAHRQMTEAGEFRGGPAPYGYRNERIGKRNKRGDKMLKEPVIDETEAETVRLVYDLCVNKGLGGMRIAQELNERGVPTRKHSKWGLAVVNYMLRNPIYKGCATYGKTRQKGRKHGRTDVSDWVIAKEPNPAIVIIDEETWERAQIIRDARTPSKYREGSIDRRNYPMQTRSNLLLVGLAYCGHCGARLSTGFSRTRWTNKDGTKHERSQNVYKCVAKTSGGHCDGQTIYSPEAIEQTVLDEVYAYLDEFSETDLSARVEQLKGKNMSEAQKRLKTQETLVASLKKELDDLNAEVIKVIRGTSTFKDGAMLEAIASETSAKLETEAKTLNELSAGLKRTETDANDIAGLARYIPVWKEEFAKADTAAKKMLLCKVVDKVIVKRDEITVKVRISAADFMASSHRLNQVDSGQPRLDEKRP